MRLFGSLREIVSAVFRKDTYEITLRPNQSTTYTAARDVQLPAKDGNAVLVSSGDIVNADINAGAAIAYSKLSLSNSIVNADVSPTAAVAYSKLNLSGSIVNADIASGASIADSKLATISTAGKVSNSATTATNSNTASAIVARDASGNFSAGTITATLSGNATNVSGTVAIANGGTGQTTQQAAMNALAGTQSSGKYLRSDGTNTSLSSIQAADVPTLNQNTTGTAANITATSNNTLTTLSSLSLPGSQVSGNISGNAANVTGTVAIANGGTGQTTANAALNALLPSQGSAANKYLKTDGTNTSWASASGGAGEINAVLNASGADGTTGWTGTSVVTGSNSPLNPIVTTAFSISNAATTESSTSGGYYPFTLPTGLMNRKLKIEFSYTTPATDVYKVSVYKGSTRVALSTDSSGSTSLPASVTGGKFVAYFDTDNSSSWTVSVTRTSGSTGPIYITNVIVGPGIQPQGAAVGPWTSYTPTGSWTTNTTYSGQYRRVGDSAEILIDVALSGAPTAARLTMTQSQLLNGLNLTINGSALPNTTDVGLSVGTWTGLDSGVLETYGGIVSMDGGANKTLTLGYPTGTNTSSAVTNTTPITWGTGDNVSIKVTVPIAEWAGSGTVQLAQNDVEYAYNTTAWGTSNTAAFGYGPVGAAITGALTAEFSQRVRFQTPIQATDILTLEFRNSASDPWMPQSSYFNAVADSIPGYTGIIATAGTDTHGAGMLRVSGSNTDVDVTFGRYVDRSYNGTAMQTKAWASGPYWRVKKTSAGAAVGFGIVSPGISSGLVSASGLPGNTTGNAIASGYVGEVQSSSWSAQTIATTATLLATISNVTPGVYLVTLNSDVSFGSATRVVGTLGGTATRTPASPTSAPEYVRAVASSTASASYVYPILVTALGTVTWSATATTASTSADCRGTINLVRIA